MILKAGWVVKDDKERLSLHEVRAVDSLGHVCRRNTKYLRGDDVMFESL